MFVEYSNVGRKLGTECLPCAINVARRRLLGPTRQTWAVAPINGLERKHACELLL
ncbi:hypothetical protein M0804_012618 [Polistes exclamans]|nr:hypothetical protein M0804_012618 [Polistes exclamans]